MLFANYTVHQSLTKILQIISVLVLKFSLLQNCRMLEKIQFYFRSLLVSGVGFTLSTSEISTLLPYDTAAHQDHCGRYWIRNPGPLPRILVRYH